MNAGLTITHLKFKDGYVSNVGYLPFNLRFWRCLDFNFQGQGVTFIDSYILERSLELRTA